MRPLLGHAFTIAFSATLLAACNSSTQPQRDAVLSISVSEPNIVITNNGSKPVFTMVLGKNYAALGDWFPCVDEAICTPIPPHGKQTRTFGDAGIDESETEALVYWWFAVMKDNVPTHDSIRLTTIRVR